MTKKKCEKKTLRRKEHKQWMGGNNQTNRRKFLCTRVRQLFKAKGPPSASQDE